MSLFLTGCIPLPTTPTPPTPVSPAQTGALGGPYIVMPEPDQTVRVKFEILVPPDVINATGIIPYPEEPVRTYFRIMQEVPISESKVKEGEKDCKPFHLHWYTHGAQNPNLGGYPPCGNEQELIKATLAEELKDYESQVYILRQNFRFEWLVVAEAPEAKPHIKPAEVVFLRINDPGDRADPQMALFDIYLAEDAEEELTVPKKRHSNEEVPPLTLPEVLQNCGQLTIIPKAQFQPGEIRLGEGAGEQPAPQLPKLPQTLTFPSSLVEIGSQIPPEDLVKIGQAPYLFGQTFQKMEVESATAHGEEYWVIINNFPGSILHPSSTPNPLSERQFKLSFIKPGGAETALLETNYNDEHLIYVLAQRAQVKFGSTYGAAGGPTLSLGAREVEITPPTGDVWCGFTPECKPAIYLYPEVPSKIKVEVGPSVGKLTQSFPPYPEGGWQVLALPNGQLFTQGQILSHLFYEALTPTPQIPPQGWSASYQDLTSLLQQVSKEIGLNQLETKELTDYWLEKLPESPFYFVGLLPRDEIDRLESLKITPTPDTLFRMRLVFIPLKKPLQISPPLLSPFKRGGFTAVEWGGYLLGFRVKGEG